MSAPCDYRGTITREQWLLNETRVVGRLMLDDGLTNLKEIGDRVIEGNLFQYPTEREQVSIARACARRLKAAAADDADILRTGILPLVAHGTVEQLAQTNLYAMARDNRLVWDFLVCVIGPKFTSFDFALTKAEIKTFLEGLRSQNGRIATWSDATFVKIGQVYVNALEGTGMYDRKTRQLQPPFLDPALENVIRTNNDLQILAAFGVRD